MIKKKAIIAAVFIFLFLLGSAIIFWPQQTINSQVTIFILDDFHQPQTITAEQRTSHGQIVKRVIKTEAPTVKIIPYSVADKQGKISKQLYFTGLREVISYAERHDKQKVIVNISLSFFSNDSLHQDLIQKLSRSQGIKLVAAAGNDDSEQPIYPAGYSEVIAVANADETGKLDASNYGQYIDIAAPGSVKQISRAYYPQGMGIQALEAAGTSFSAPRVVGLLAQLVSKQHLDLDEAWQIISETARPIKSDYYQADQLGAGVIDKSLALRRAAPEYQFKKEMILIIGLIILGLISGWLLINYQVIGIFYILLLSLVGIPLAVLAGERFRQGVELVIGWAAVREIGWPTVLGSAGSIVTALVITTWQRSKVFASYLVLLLGSLLFSSQFSAKLLSLFWGWTGLLLGLEVLFYFYLSQIIEPEKLLNFSWLSAQRLRELIKSRLVKQGRQTIPVLKYNLLTASSLHQKIMSIEVLVNFSPVPVKTVILFAAEYNLSAKQLFNWWQQVAEVEIEQLFDLTQHQNKSAAKLAVEILKKLPPEKVVDKIRPQLTSSNVPNKKILLDILIHYRTAAKTALPEVVGIICGADDVWLRYKGLRALQTIAPAPEKFISLFQILQQEEEELIRLEAEGMMKEAVDCK